MPAPDKLTISAAARLTDVARRTLQRAIQTGRLHLDADYCLDREELLAAGYLDPHMAQAASHHVTHRVTQAAPQAAPQEMAQEVSQALLFLPLLERFTTAVEVIGQELRALHATLRQMSQEASQCTSQRTSQPAPRGIPQQTPQDAPQDTPQPDDCPPFDATKNTLGKLCPRGHAWGRTGQSLLRLPNQTCRQCENERRRERRAAQRQGPPS